jgi:hypothetical protein
MERLLGYMPVLLGGYACFLVMDRTGAGTGLSNAKIFSSMDLIYTLKFTILMFAVGLGHYFEIKVIF